MVIFLGFLAPADQRGKKRACFSSFLLEKKRQKDMFFVQKCGLATLFLLKEKNLLVSMLGQVQPLEICFFCRASIKISPPLATETVPFLARNSGKDSWQHSTLYGEFPALQLYLPFSLVSRLALSVRNLRWRLLMLWKAVVFVAVLVFILVHMIVFAKSDTSIY